LSLLEIMLTSIALAMDAFAVSISSGMCIRDFKLNHGLRFGLYFGFFQFSMAVLGFFLAFSYAGYIRSFDHWIAFILLGVIGGKMIYETFKEEELECDVLSDAVMNFKNMIMLSIATSIDAMAVGVSFAFLEVNIWDSAASIGIVTFVLSFAGGFIGNKIGGFFHKETQRIGGVVLIFIGLKILIEHLSIGG